ncbi:hypothetical protein AB7M49_008436 [Bradyrhizobium elkanii]|nr:hypothetical protein [Bradyrhizobium elkanii]MCP1969427.1 hypothetical protein [Bradyrhizobium elkanii]MCS4109066.1 hypothetical protein [Bradyrhizobium elkanii]
MLFASRGKLCAEANTLPSILSKRSLKRQHQADRIGGCGVDEQAFMERH